MRVPAVAPALVFALLAAACSIDRHANPSFGCDGCLGECIAGLCVVRSASGGRDDDGGIADGGIGVGGADGSVDGGEVVETCTEPDATEFCYSGPSGTGSTGVCRAGMRTCAGGVWSRCLGEITPSEAERCNGDDDDCDGKTDEAIPPASCNTGQEGVCMEGAPRCAGGVETCDRARDPAPETCDGEDDDCDGTIDEGTAGACYPSALDGCTDDGEGGFTCVGTCSTGMRECVDGELEPCAGHVAPTTEACGGSVTAADEDCDGSTDEGCPCTGSEVQSCSSGGNPGVGECTAGTQTCNGSTFGSCTGEVLPTAETCGNEGADDDCNDIDDDVPMRGDSCIDEAADGACRDGTLECVGGALVCDTREAESEICNGHDDDCDGKTDEAFNLQTDEQNCGRCDMACTNNRTCCAGTCVDTSTDENHCKSCGAPCGAGLTCCDSECVDLETDEQNCNMCGQACGGVPPCCIGGACNVLLCL